MAKRKPNKRRAKKQTKKQQISLLQQHGYTDKNIKNLTVSERTQTVKRINRNIRQKERRAENLLKWEQLNIDRSIITRYDLRNK